MNIITVARQIGSGGDRIAERVAEILGYEYLDQRLTGLRLGYGPLGHFSATGLDDLYDIHSFGQECS